ncbi:ribonuclease H-like domain-containing protein [Tanacetum coccineum]|uniref:Ribonuclease H-like domain-containing protein n=1 Tax=Tanacetum coccineum TaxID=301880 RepID=A0ABQ5FFR6_9ASTR
MVTRSQSGIIKLVDHLSLHTSSISLIPKSSFLALKDRHWCNAMSDEYNAGSTLFSSHAHMVNCNPSRTPVDTESKLGPKGVPVQDPTLYCSLAGGRHYLTFTRLDLYYAGILDFSLHLYGSATTSLVGYTDADWLGCPSTRSSTSGYCVRVLHVPSRYQYADIFTKGLPSALFEDFRSTLSVRPPPAPTAGAY